MSATRLDCTDEDARRLRDLIESKPSDAVSAAQRTSTLASWVKALLDDRAKLRRRERELDEQRAGLIEAVKARDQQVKDLRESSADLHVIASCSVEIRQRYAAGFDNVRPGSTTERWRLAVDRFQGREDDRVSAPFNAPRFPPALRVRPA